MLHELNWKISGFGRKINIFKVVIWNINKLSEMNEITSQNVPKNYLD